MAKAQDEAQIKALQQKWMQAWAEEDLDTIDEILAPEFELIVSSHPERPITREQWIAMLPRYKTNGFAYDRMYLRFFGEIAVVSSFGKALGARVDGIDRSFTFFLTDVWQKRGDRWQVVSRYSSIPETPSGGLPNPVDASRGVAAAT